LGLAIVVCSWWLHLKSSDYRPLLNNQWFTAPIILIVSGLHLQSYIINRFRSFLAKCSMVLGAVGCLGAWYEKKALLFIVIKNFDVFFENLNFVCLISI
jgi:hypothetical protein